MTFAVKNTVESCLEVWQRVHRSTTATVNMYDCFSASRWLVIIDNTLQIGSVFGHCWNAADYNVNQQPNSEREIARLTGWLCFV